MVIKDWFSYITIHFPLDIAWFGYLTQKLILIMYCYHNFYSLLTLLFNFTVFVSIV